MQCNPLATSVLLRIVALPLMLIGMYAPRQASANIFGVDDRTPIESREYPWHCLGLIVADEGSGVVTGTGFLIGRNLVLTNAHCTRNETTGELFDRIYFVANRVRGVARNVVHVNRVWRGTDHREDSRHDWAVLRLDSNLGDDLGWLTLSDNLPKRAILAGYSGDYQDQQTAAQAPGALTSVLPWLVYHDADATRGSSGGPMLAEEDGKLVVVALNFGEFRDSSEFSLTIDAYDSDHANLAISVASLSDDVQAILDDAESRQMADQASLARRQFAAREFNAARETLSALVASCPENSWSILLRGQASHYTGDLAAAAADYQLARDVDPDCLNLLLQRASYCYQSSNYRECVAIATRVLMAENDNALAQQLRSAANQQIGVRPFVVAGADSAD